MNRDTGVVLAAGGTGSRFGSLKQFLDLAGRPMLFYSLDAFAGLEAVAEIVVVCPAAQVEAARGLLSGWRQRGARLPVAVVAGGRRRQDSVLAGLEALERSRYVLVHDAARPLVRRSEAEKVLAAIRESGAAALGTPCSDSIKRVAGGLIVEEIPRGDVWTVQTPQGAEIERLRAAYRDVGEEHLWTDEASLLRAAGGGVAVVAGSPENIKITTPGDELLAEAILRGRRLNEA